MSFKFFWNFMFVECLITFPLIQMHFQNRLTNILNVCFRLLCLVFEAHWSSVRYLLKCSLQSVLFEDWQLAHGLPAALQLIHLLLQPVSISCAAPGQIPDRPLQGPDASGSFAQLLLEGLTKHASLRKLWFWFKKGTSMYMEKRQLETWYQHVLIKIDQPLRKNPSQQLLHQ